jgi:MHS family proline/betaine transporter-like MFS transporter
MEAAWDSAPAPVERRICGIRVSENLYRAFAANIGNILEWYDFAVFGYLAEVFGKLFFVASNPTVGLLESFAVFGGAFFMRPVGGVILGSIGDRFGRKRALEISIMLMACCTFALGCLPTYHTIGVLAPVLMVLLRLLQGVSVGGQLVGSFVFTIESAPPGSRVLYGGLCMGTAVFGSMLGSFVASLLHLLPEEHLYSWGWRLPFWSGIFVAFVGLHIQRQVEDSPEFLALHESGATTKSPFYDSMTKWVGIRQREGTSCYY